MGAQELQIAPFRFTQTADGDKRLESVRCRNSYTLGYTPEKPSVYGIKCQKPTRSSNDLAPALAVDWTLYTDICTKQGDPVISQEQSIGPDAYVLHLVQGCCGPHWLAREARSSDVQHCPVQGCLHKLLQIPLTDETAPAASAAVLSRERTTVHKHSDLLVSPVTQDQPQQQPVMQDAYPGRLLSCWA